MKLISVLVFSLSTLLVSAVPIAQAESWVDPNCECNLTSSSPLGTDMEKAINVLLEKGNARCIQTSSVAPFCTTLSSYGGAVIDICGPEGFSLACDDAGLTTWQISDVCTRWDGEHVESWQVGGKYHREADGATQFAGMALYGK